MRHDLVSLDLFVCVAECGNLTRAAERRHLAVSAVSKRISELEALIGTPLLVRQPRGVRLTPAGQSLLHHARQMLQLVARMDEELGAYAGGLKGHVRMQAVASALTQFLPEELRDFLVAHPGVQVSVEERTGRDIVRAVQGGAADLGLVAATTPIDGLSAQAYHVDRLMLGVPRRHALARRRSVRFAEALAHPFVGPQPESSLAQLMEQGARAACIALQQRIQASSFDAMCRLVETGLGVTLLPERVLSAPVAAGRLVAVALREDWACRQMLIVSRGERELGPVTRTLIDHLQRAAAFADGERSRGERPIFPGDGSA